MYTIIKDQSNKIQDNYKIKTVRSNSKLSNHLTEQNKKYVLIANCIPHFGPHCKLQIQVQFTPRAYTKPDSPGCSSFSKSETLCWSREACIPFEIASQLWFIFHCLRNISTFRNAQRTSSSHVERFPVGLCAPESKLNFVLFFCKSLSLSSRWLVIECARTFMQKFTCCVLRMGGGVVLRSENLIFLVFKVQSCSENRQPFQRYPWKYLLYTFISNAH